jgi:hypothetical protein
MLCLRWFANGDVGTSAHRFILATERSAPLAARECYLARAALQSAWRSNLRITCASIGCIAAVFSRPQHESALSHGLQANQSPKIVGRFVVICRSAIVDAVSFEQRAAVTEYPGVSSPVSLQQLDRQPRGRVVHLRSLPANCLDRSHLGSPHQSLMGHRSRGSSALPRQRRV